MKRDGSGSVSTLDLVTKQGDVVGEHPQHLLVAAGLGAARAQGVAHVPLEHAVDRLGLSPLTVSLAALRSLQSSAHDPPIVPARPALARPADAGLDDRPHAHVVPRDPVVGLGVVPGVGQQRGQPGLFTLQRTQAQQQGNSQESEDGKAGEEADFDTIDRYIAAHAIDRSVAEEAMARGDRIILDFYATWCTTCARQQRVMEALRAENPAYDRDLTLIHVDWDRFGTGDLARRLAVPRRSTIIALKGDQELGRSVAGTAIAEIRSLFDMALTA